MWLAKYILLTAGKMAALTSCLNIIHLHQLPGTLNGKSSPNSAKMLAILAATTCGNKTSKLLFTNIVYIITNLKCLWLEQNHNKYHSWRVTSSLCKVQDAWDEKSVCIHFASILGFSISEYLQYYRANFQKENMIGDTFQCKYIVCSVNLIFMYWPHSQLRQSARSLAPRSYIEEIKCFLSSMSVWNASNFLLTIWIYWSVLPLPWIARPEAKRTALGS